MAATSNSAEARLQSSGNSAGGGTLADGVSDRAGRLGLEIADIAGTVEDLGKLNVHLWDTLEEVVDSAHATATTNNQIAAAMEVSRESAISTRAILTDCTGQVAKTLADAIQQMQGLSEGVFGVANSLEIVRETIGKVHNASEAIQNISVETQIIAINAGVEAARAGDAGRGFAVISKSIRSLADQVRNISSESERSLVILQETVDKLLACARGNVVMARSAIEYSNSASSMTGQINSLASTVQQLLTNIESLGGPVQRNIDSGERVRNCLNSLTDAVQQSNSRLSDASRSAETVLEFSEDLILCIAESGVKTRDSEIIDIAQATAPRIVELLEGALASKRLSLEALFDTKYVPVPNSDPQQFTTRYIDVFDQILPDVQEPILALNNRIAFCAAIDRNGYLPTHNKRYSKPQTDDPAWNAANCRNRRIFNDRTGLAAGRNERPFLLQTYRRDMGDGNFIIMKDASAPIFIRGRHWGGFRIGFKA